MKYYMAVLVAVGAMTVAVAADYRYWAGADGESFADGAKWNPAFSSISDVSGDTFSLNNGTNPQIASSEEFSAGRLYVGWGWIWTLNQDGDYVASQGVSNDNGGALDVSGGSLNVSQTLYLGASYSDIADARVRVSSGTVTAGKLEMADCSCVSGKKNVLEVLGEGTVNITNVAKDIVRVGRWPTGTGEIYVHGNGRLSVHTSGAVESVTAIGYGTATTGTLHVAENGQFRCGTLRVGESGSGELLIEGNGLVNTAWMSAYIGYENGSSGRVRITGGQFDAGNDIYVGFKGAGELIVDGGVVSCGYWIDICRDDSNNGAQSVVYLNAGGTINVGKVQHNAGHNSGVGNPKFVWNGGVFKANEHYGDTGDIDIFPDTKINVQVLEGGAIVDTNGKKREMGHSLKGVGAFTKRGVGDLTLKGEVELDGGFSVEAGTLRVENLASAHVAMVNISEGALLDLNGASITADECMINGKHRYGTVELGNGYGTITVTGAAQISGVTTIDAEAAASDICDSALAWYDFSDEATVTTQDGAITAVGNKGTAGASLDCVAFGGTSSAYGIAELNGLSVMSMTNSRALVSANAAGIVGNADRTLVVLGRTRPNTYTKANSDEYQNEAFFLGIESGGDSGVFRIEDRGWMYSLEYNNERLGGVSHNKGDKWCVWIMTSEQQSTNVTVNASVWTEGSDVVEAATTGNIDSLDTESSSKIYLGMRYQFGSPSSGDIAEAMVFDRALSAAEQADILAYLRRKWFNTPDPRYTPPSVDLADDAILDLDGMSVSFDSITGDGIVANGTVASVAGEVSCGIMLPGSPDLSAATLRVNVSSDGTVSSPLVVEESVDVSKMKINVVGAANLKPNEPVAIFRTTHGFPDGRTGWWNVSSDDGLVGLRVEILGNEIYLSRISGLVFGVSPKTRVHDETPAPIHVEGRHIVDDKGNCVRLMGVMRSIHPYFDGGLWGGGRDDAAKARAYDHYDKLLTGLSDRSQGSYANMIRLTDDGHWSWDSDKRGGDENPSFYATDWVEYTNYVENLLVPIAENAISKGIYVLIRPSHNNPGVTWPGCEYQEHLKKEWSVLASNKRLQALSGQVVFEIQNEPTTICMNEAGDRHESAMALFMQPVFDKIRECGFNGIILVPGMGYQSYYKDYAQYPIVGENFGFAVHVYPGWYNQKDETADADRFVANFLNQVPVAMNYPIVVTEQDWSPVKPGEGKYNEFGEWVPANWGSWGTGSSSMYGRAYFGMLDRLGNVSTIAGDLHIFFNHTNYLNKGVLEPAYGGERECCAKAFWDLFRRWSKAKPQTPRERDANTPRPLEGDEVDLTEIQQLASNYFRMTNNKHEIHINAKAFQDWDFRYGDPVAVGRNPDDAHLFKAIPHCVDGKLCYSLKCYDMNRVVRLCGSDSSQGDAICMSSNWDGFDQDSSRTNSTYKYGRKQDYDGLWFIEKAEGGFAFKNVAMDLWLGSNSLRHSPTQVVWRCTTRAKTGDEIADLNGEVDFGEYVKPAAYRNPVLYTDCPDVSLCSSGEYVYMVSTTMHLSPGCPVMRSKDMVHWETVSYVIDGFGEDQGWPAKYRMETSDGACAYAAGQWASTIREHNGKFYVYFIANGVGGFLYSADRPEGPWTLRNRMPFKHDASLLFDDDGKAYLFHGTGWVSRLKDDLTGVDPDWKDYRFFTLGEETGLIEGSNAFKKDGWYYVMMVSAYLPGHPRREVCFRSRTLDNTEWEKKVILETVFDRKGGVGQGAVVEAPDGNWYALVFQDRGGVGRTPCLMPVRWKNGWPMLGDSLGLIPNNKAMRYPDLSGISGSDDFDGNTLSLLWQWNHEPLASAWSLSERLGWLRLRTANVANNIYVARNTLTQRMPGPVSSGIVKMDLSGMRNGDRSGIAAFQGSGAVCQVEMKDGVKTLTLSEQKGNFSDHDDARYVSSATVTTHLTQTLSSNAVWLQVSSDFTKDRAYMAWSPDGENWNWAVDSSGNKIGVGVYFNTGTMFMGTKFALFNYATEATGGYVDFDYFELTAEDHEAKQ